MATREELQDAIDRYNCASQEEREKMAEPITVGGAVSGEIEDATRVRFTYKNYRNEVGERLVIPREFYFGATAYHPQPQWLMRAYDIDKQGPRTFAMKDISNWRPA